MFSRSFNHFFKEKAQVLTMPNEFIVKKQVAYFLRLFSSSGLKKLDSMLPRINKLPGPMKISPFKAGKQKKKSREVLDARVRSN